MPFHELVLVHPFCDNKSYYVGITEDLDKRVAEHKSKESRYTKRFNFIDLVYSEKFETHEEAVRREKQVKGWTSKKKRLLLERNKQY